MQCQTMIKPVGIKHSGVVLVMGILNYVHSGLMCVVLIHAFRILSQEDWNLNQLIWVFFSVQAEEINSLCLNKSQKI